MSEVLANLSEASRLLAECTTIPEAKHYHDIAEAARSYARMAGLGLEAQNHATEVKLRAERKMGDLLRERPEIIRSTRGGTSKPLPPEITRKQSSRWQKEAKIPEEKFEKYIASAKAKGEEITSAGVERLTRKAHVSYNSGDNEWYTPKEYIEAAREVMGSIDLDPASTETANAIVQAETFYSLQEDGLKQDWLGNVWMNPPYAGELIGGFIEKLLFERHRKDVLEACVLVNNATETKWFQLLALGSEAICFPRGRIKFWHPTKESVPLQGQAIFYMGGNRKEFGEIFSAFGVICEIY